MATVRLNPAFDSVHGKLGKIVHYNRNGVQCARSYAVPRNPDTPAQRKNRKTFAEAVKLWQELTPEGRYSYNRKALKLRMSGYNLFISRHLKVNSTVSGHSPSAFIRPSKIHESKQLRSVSTVPPFMKAYSKYTAHIQPFASDHG